MSVKAINVDKVTHIYGENTIFETKAIDSVSFEIEKGDFIGLIGCTGSGKSTIIQHLNRLLSPSSGSVVIEGTDINKKGVLMKDICKKVGIVFQYPEYQLFEESVYRDIAFGPKNLGLSDIDVDFLVRDAMEMVSLDFEKYKDTSPFELSGGQKRRVAIAGVLAMNPHILILDEPASGLDPKSRKEILGNIQSLHKNRDLTIILVSHSMEDISLYANKVMCFSKGKMVEYANKKEVFREVKNLEDIGLKGPITKYLLYKLKEKGFDVNTNVFTKEEVLEEIKKQF